MLDVVPKSAGSVRVVRIPECQQEHEEEASGHRRLEHLDGHDSREYPRVAISLEQRQPFTHTRTINQREIEFRDCAVPRIGAGRSFARRFTTCSLFARRIAADRSLALLSPYLLFPSTSMSFLVTPPPSLAVHSFEHRADSFSRRSPRWDVRRGRATAQLYACARSRAKRPPRRTTAATVAPFKSQTKSPSTFNDPNCSLDPIENSPRYTFTLRPT